MSGYECEDCGKWVDRTLPPDYMIGATRVHHLPICLECDDVRIANGFYDDDDDD